MTVLQMLITFKVLIDVPLERKLRVESAKALADDAFEGVGAGVGDVMTLQPTEGRRRTVEHLASQPPADEFLGRRSRRRRIPCG